MFGELLTDAFGVVAALAYARMVPETEPPTPPVPWEWRGHKWPSVGVLTYYCPRRQEDVVLWQACECIAHATAADVEELAAAMLPSAEALRDLIRRRYDPAKVDPAAVAAEAERLAAMVEFLSLGLED